jgi:hypothetical protein
MLVGCAAQTLNEGTEAANDLSGKIASVGSDIDYSIPHADADGQTRLRGAKTTLSAAEADVPKVLAALSAQQARADKAEAGLKAERNHWVGYKARVAAWWIIGLTLTFGAIVAGLYVFTPLAAPIGTAFHVVTAGTVALLRKLRDAVEAKFAKKTPAQTAPVKPNPTPPPAAATS